MLGHEAGNMETSVGLSTEFIQPRPIPDCAEGDYFPGSARQGKRLHMMLLLKKTE